MLPHLAEVCIEIAALALFPLTIHQIGVFFCCKVSAIVVEWLGHEA